MKRKPHLSDIPIGAPNAVSRAELSRIWGLSDRKVRRCISEMRTEEDGSDLVIVSHSNGRGYYRTDNPEEIEHFIHETQKRARNTFAAIRTARHALKRIRAKEQYTARLDKDVMSCPTVS